MKVSYQIPKQKLMLESATQASSRRSYVTRPRYKPYAGAMGLAAVTVFASKILSTEIINLVDDHPHGKKKEKEIKS